MRIDKQLSELDLFLEKVEEFLDNQAGRAETDDERRKMEGYFPNLLRSSLFVTIYSAVENELNRLSRELSKADGLDVEDLRGSGILRASTFLIRVCRVDFPENSDEWKLLQELNQLRNLIVHNNGRLTGNEHFESLLSDCSGLDLKDENITLGRSFCPQVLDTVGKFFRQLITAVDKKAGASRDGHRPH